MQSMQVDQPILELVKPDIFDEAPRHPQCWLSFYEYACDYNIWLPDEEKIKNTCLFLGGVAKKWYDLRVLSSDRHTWPDWKQSFQPSLGKSKFQAWDNIIAFKYHSGPVLEYFV